MMTCSATQLGTHRVFACAYMQLSIYTSNVGCQYRRQLPPSHDIALLACHLPGMHFESRLGSSQPRYVSHKALHTASMPCVTDCFCVSQHNTLCKPDMSVHHFQVSSHVFRYLFCLPGSTWAAKQKCHFQKYYNASRCPFH